MSTTASVATATTTEAAIPAALSAIGLPETRKNAVYFFGTQGSLGPLSNFSAHPFVINGVLWKTVEHYYHAQKFIGTQAETDIRESADPVDARQISKAQGKELVRPDWNDLKEKVMYAALLAKFSQNNAAATALLDTQNAFLVQHSKKDGYWGDGHATGLNRLGVLLMEVRGQIRTQLGLPEPTTEYVSEKDEKSEAELKKMLAKLMEKSEEIDEGIIATSAPPRTKRKPRTRPGTASKPFRTADGTPIFEKDMETGQVSVMDSDFLLDAKALTPAARTVTFLYQFEKRNRREENKLEPEDLEVDEEDELESPEDLELEAQYLPPSVRPSDEDICNENAVEQLLEETELAIVMAASIDDRESDDFKAFAVQIHTLRHELHKHVHNIRDEKTLDRTLTMISTVDDLVGVEPSSS